MDSVQITPEINKLASNMPSHVAIIMDGNGRWAKQRFLNRIKGHEKGAESVRVVVRTCREIGIPILTLYAFSTENWQRPKAEISALMNLLMKFIREERKELLDRCIRFNAIGQIERLPENVQIAVHNLMEESKNNDAMLLNIALSYGSRAEIVQMARLLAEKAKCGEIEPDAITEQVVSDHLYTKGMADPDLLIRTSGEMRISNFLLWQIAYAEIYITDTLWPDFGKEEFIRILNNYGQRERRFGKVPLKGIIEK